MNLFARVGVASHERRCPACDSIVYSRRHKLCGVCSAVLPDEVLFNDAQARNVAGLVAEERAQHRVWLRRVNWAQ